MPRLAILQGGKKYIIIYIKKRNKNILFVDFKLKIKISAQRATKAVCAPATATANAARIATLLASCRKTTTPRATRSATTRAASASTTRITARALIPAACAAAILRDSAAARPAAAAAASATWCATATPTSRLGSATCLQKTGSETGFLAQNLDRLLDRDFQGRVSDRKAENLSSGKTVQ